MNKRLPPLVRSIAPRIRRIPSPDDAPEQLETPMEAVEQGSSVVDSAVYEDGKRIASKTTLPETFRCQRENPGSTAWIGMYRPSPDELASLAGEFEFHDLAVEDAILAHQRPKLERYGQTLFVVMMAARYLDAPEEVQFDEVHIFVGPDVVVTVRHSDAPDLASVRRRMESEPDLLRRGPEAILYAILDKVVDGYMPVIAGLANDIEQIEIEVFRGDPQVSKRIYQLSREVIEFQRASQPLTGMLQSLGGGFDKYGIDEELQRYLRDVADHVTQVVERVDGFRQLLRDMLAVNATLVAQAQNEEMKSLTQASNAQNEEVKKISAWAAILFAPTLIGTIYGMNFTNMPELGWAFGYPFAVGMMMLVCIVLYFVFKRRDWL